MLCQGVDKGFSCARTDSAQDSLVCCNNVTPPVCYSITQVKLKNTKEKGTTPKSRLVRESTVRKALVILLILLLSVYLYHAPQ
jgi:hypothetical protein